MNMGRPLVSILTPLYNAESYIEEVLSAVFNQTYSNIEHIVVDDGSTDASSERVECFMKEHPNAPVCFLRQENTGEAAAVNRAFESSSGTYVVVVNADDPPLEDLITLTVAMLESSPKTVAVYPDWHMIDAGGNCIKSIQTLDYSLDILVGDFWCIPGPGAMIRASALSGDRFRDPSYRFISDLEMWLRLSLRGPMQRCPVVLATRRSHASGATVAGRGRPISDEIERLYGEFFSRHDLLSDVRSLEKRARAMTLFERGTQKFFDHSIAGRRMVLSSLIILPWRRSSTVGRRRSLIVMLAVLGVPFSSWMLGLLRRFGVRGYV